MATLQDFTTSIEMTSNNGDGDDELWNSRNEAIFIRIMHEHVKRGELHTSTEKVWGMIDDELIAETGKRYTIPQLKAKFNQLRKKYCEFSDLLNHTGFGWDLISNTVTASEDDVWMEQPAFPPFLITYLYVAHFLARWGARMWEFSVGLYMISVWPDSLLFAATYGAVESASIALFGPIVGDWVDKLTYVKVLRIWLVTQNLSFIVAGVSVISLLFFSSLQSVNFTKFMPLVMLTNISGAVGVISTLAGTILIEREWVVVISEGHPPEVLSKMNSIIRCLDLTCKLLAPVITGFIISFVSLKASAMTLAIWTTVTIWVEYWLFMSVLKGIPALGKSSQRRITRSTPIAVEESTRMAKSMPIDVEESTSNFQESESLLSNEGSNATLAKKSWRRKMIDWISNVPCVKAWRVYLKQDVVLPGVSLALLFFTVLSFRTLMTATLEWQGIPTYIIGIARGISATIGIAATVVYPTLQSRILTLRTGLWSIWSQWTCLLVCVASIWVHGSLLAAYMLIVGVATSRRGLWMFDLSVIQQTQDIVPESDRCVVGGVQNSLQSTLELMAYVMGIIISNPQDFWKLILVSFLAVTLAGLLYTFHLFRIRKHVFHFDKLLAFVQWIIRCSKDARST